MNSEWTNFKANLKRKKNTIWIWKKKNTGLHLHIIINICMIPSSKMRSRIYIFSFSFESAHWSDWTNSIKKVYTDLDYLYRDRFRIKKKKFQPLRKWVTSGLEHKGLEIANQVSSFFFFDKTNQVSWYAYFHMGESFTWDGYLSKHFNSCIFLFSIHFTLALSFLKNIFIIKIFFYLLTHPTVDLLWLVYCWSQGNWKERLVETHTSLRRFGWQNGLYQSDLWKTWS